MSSLCVRCVTILFVMAALSGCKSGTEKEQEMVQVSDIDGISYHTIPIGNQVWMSENLKTTTYSDGTPIPNVEEYEEWANLTVPAYSWYNNDSLNSVDYGALYNFYAVETDMLCPDGWHTPSDEDWIELESFLGGGQVLQGL